MSELQLSLIVVGLLVIAGVYVFNVMQERRFRENSEQALDPGQDDDLLPEGPTLRDVPEPQSEPRIEPSFEGEPPPAATESHAVALEPRAPSPDPAVGDGVAAIKSTRDTSTPREPNLAAVTEAVDIDFRAQLEGGMTLDGDTRSRLEKQIGSIGKPIRMEVRDAADGTWRPQSEAGAEGLGPVRIALQLADRAGPVSAAQLSRFREIVEGAAGDLGATVHFDDEAEALARAVELDAFCADNDVAIGLNIIPRDITGLAGTKLRALAEASGFILKADGSFHLCDERGTTLIALTSMDGVPLEASSLKALRSQGVTLLIDVTRVVDGRQIFRRMTDLAKQFAASLNGIVVDDNRTPLTVASLEKIAGQIDAIQSALRARGIAPGGPIALRLFS